MQGIKIKSGLATHMLLIMCRTLLEIIYSSQTIGGEYSFHYHFSSKKLETHGGTHLSTHNQKGSEINRLMQTQEKKNSHLKCNKRKHNFKEDYLYPSGNFS